MLFVKHIYYSLRGIPALGYINALKLIWARYFEGEFSIHPKGYPAPVFIRGKTSDADIVCNILVFHEYRIPELNEIIHIVDAGANIGIAAVFFANCYPDSKIISIEPEASNFALLRKNTAHLPNVTIVHAALWSTESPLRVIDSGSAKWGFQFKSSESDTADVMGVTLQKLIGDGVDLLKIDIEGGEKEVFSSNVDWADRVRFLLLEIHPGCWKTVFKAIKDINYDCRIYGENILFDFQANRKGSS